MERTVLIGASFGGLEFLYRTARRRGKRFAAGEMTVIEPRRSHAYIPLTHEVLSSAQQAEHVLFDAERFCHAIGATFMAQRATRVNRRDRLVHVMDGTAVPYDRLVVATGSVPDVPLGAAGCDTVFAAKFLEDAVRLRARIMALHAARNDTVHAVVIGAGITGVEWSAELARRGVDGCQLDVTLITKDARILGELTPRVARHATHVLHKLGVRLRLSENVAAVHHNEVVTANGTKIPCDVTIWAAGVRPAPFIELLDLPLTASGHLVVDPHLTVPDDPHIAAMGDAVRVVQQNAEWPTAVRAIEAIWQGAYLARRPVSPYRFHGPFFYGVSLGSWRSMLVYRWWYLDTPLFVLFRRFLQWGYYSRFRLLMRSMAERKP